ncbi:glycosyltransferase family 2 protein [Eggerthella guodeyinii]|uniref:Glycosyltransferase family 2 protein n=1 Tax=Eggerthella guodeyinii TaxID=2690837 RepID=A0A6L7IZA5_9ACTN|nr:glycosyltransferase family 2 protein [Eggerthella guodeyinii]QOS67178.1 glycosyltransferase family 2 protein [Eggerthella guodeyinii]
MAQSPCVSVVVPMYNAEGVVEDCLNSVLSQTLSDFELICVDDESTDGTCSLVETLAARDDRIRFLKQKSSGPGVARNAGLAAARGTFVYCLDADDFIERNMLALCVRALEETESDVALVAFCTYNDQCRRAFPAEWSMRNEDVYPSYPSGTFSWSTAPDLFFETVQNVPWNKVVRRSLLAKHNIRFQELRLTEDLMYSLPAAVAAQRIVRVSKPLVVHREYSGTNAMSDKGRHPLDFLKAFDALKVWLHAEGKYDSLRSAYQTWLLDAVYYNLPTYRTFEGFSSAFDLLVSDDLRAFDLADMEIEAVRDHRHRAVLEALRLGSRERFLLACANVEAAEVEEQRCGFQDRQTSLRWLARCLRDRMRG